MQLNPCRVTQEKNGAVRYLKMRLNGILSGVHFWIMEDLESIFFNNSNT